MELIFAFVCLWAAGAIYFLWEVDSDDRPLPPGGGRLV